jgi:hypothetical protein
MKNKLFISLIMLLMISATTKLFPQDASTEQAFEKYRTPELSFGSPIKGLDKLALQYTVTNVNHDFSSVLMPKGTLDMVQVKQNVDVQTGKEKSVWLGVALSALVPGAGEFYAKSYLKAAIFFGVEVLAWSTYAYYNHKGNAQTNDFQTYANNNWNVRQYAQWLVDMGFEGASVINPNEPNLDILRNELNQCESQNFSHTLPAYYTQQYYEEIGKYQPFEAGWPDAREPGGAWIVTKENYETYKTPIFISYSYSREQANTYYNDGQIGAMVALLNHVLSAADAAWSVSMFNKSLRVQTGMEIRRDISPYTLKMESIPTFHMSVSF